MGFSWDFNGILIGFSTELLASSHLSQSDFNMLGTTRFQVLKKVCKIWTCLRTPQKKYSMGIPLRKSEIIFGQSRIM